MHIPDDDMFAGNNYGQTLGTEARTFDWIGTGEVLYFKGLTVFDPPDRYVIGEELTTTFADMKRKHYADYERQAFELGKKLVEKASQ